MLVALSNMISMYFPKREELSFLVVLALPNASMIGFVARIASSVLLMASWPFLTLVLSGDSLVAKYRMMYFALTVFPAPDSPETTIVWFLLSRSISLSPVSRVFAARHRQTGRE